MPSQLMKTKEPKHRHINPTKRWQHQYFLIMWILLLLILVFFVSSFYCCGLKFLLSASNKSLFSVIATVCLIW